MSRQETSNTSIGAEKMATNTPKRTATPRKSTTSKTTAHKTTEAKPASGADVVKPEAAASVATTTLPTAPEPTAPEPTAPEPTVVSVTDTTVSEPDLKKRELIDLVVARSGIKKKDAKPVVEAMLAVLGETIAAGRELNLQPLGKLRINRVVEKGNGRVIICKLRQSLSASTGPATAPAKEPLAEGTGEL